MKKLLLFLLLIPAISFSQETYEGFNTFLDTYVSTNGTRAITGSIMNSTLKQINQSLGLRYYDATRPYQEDSVAVIYDGDIWINITAIATPEAWNESKWKKVTLFTDDGDYATADTNINIANDDAYYIGGYRFAHNGGVAFNTYLGYNSGNFTGTGAGNSCIGWQSGYSFTTGAYNTYLGWRCGVQTTTGDENTFIGYNSGYGNLTGSGNVFIGYSAGYSETGSNKLYIENSSSSTPLIGGDFSANTVTINGALQMGTGVFATSGDIRLNKSASIQWRNGSNTANIQGIRMNGDVVQLADGTVDIETDGDVKPDGTLTLVDTAYFVDGTDTLYIQHTGNYWNIATGVDDTDTICLDANVKITGILNTDIIPHMFAFFGDSTVTYTFALADTWYHLSNASDSLWRYTELEQFTISEDTIIFGASGDYNLDHHLTFFGGNQDTYSVRYYNVTQAQAIPTSVGQTGQGALDGVSINIMTYAEGIQIGDRVILQVKCDDTEDMILKNSTIRIQYIHD